MAQQTCADWLIGSHWPLARGRVHCFVCGLLCVYVYFIGGFTKYHQNIGHYNQEGEEVAPVGPQAQPSINS
jgi:hypothetical protein